MNTKLLFAILTGGLCSLPYAGYATPITPSVGSESLVAFYNASTNNQIGSAACFNFSSASGSTVGCSGDTTTPTTGSTLHYLTTATAAYGTLKAGGTSSISGSAHTTNTTDYSSSLGEAYFKDSWTITGGTGTGTLLLQFALDGSYDFCDIHSGLTLGFGLTNLDGGSSSGGLGPSGCSNSVSTTVPLTTTFTFGTPLDFMVSLGAGSDLFDLGNDISSSVDFSNTAKMSAIVVKDSGGSVIPFKLSTASGAPAFSLLAPGPAPSPVPEPSSISLLGAGLAGLLAAYGRKRKSHSASTGRAPENSSR